MNAKKPTVIELFAGTGGMALGLEKAGFETKLLVEYDKDCVATLQKNRPKWNVTHDDIHNIDFKGMKADVVTGGFPCQAFSHAGNKLGFEDTRGTLFYEFATASSLSGTGVAAATWPWQLMAMLSHRGGLR